MTMRLISDQMACANAWGSRAGTASALIAKPSIPEKVFRSRVRSLIKVIFALLAIALPLFLSPKVHAEVRIFLKTFYESQKMWIHPGKSPLHISKSERGHEANGMKTADISSEDAFAWQSLEYQGRLNVEAISGHVSAPLALELPPVPTFLHTELNFANAYSGSLGSNYEDFHQSKEAPGQKPETRLARVTAYWPEEGDVYTRRRMSSTGVRLRDGHCAVDPKVIPYGSVVKVTGVGEYLAVDTGPAVVSRRAARQAGRTSRERNALVVDVYCSSRSKARSLVQAAPAFAVITWYRQ